MPLHKQEPDFQTSPRAAASVLAAHAATLRSIARALDQDDFEPHGFAGARMQGSLHHIAQELEELAGDFRQIRP